MGAMAGFALPGFAIGTVCICKCLGSVDNNLLATVVPSTQSVIYFMSALFHFHAPYLPGTHSSHLYSARVSNLCRLSVGDGKPGQDPRQLSHRRLWNSRSELYGSPRRYLQTQSTSHEMPRPRAIYYGNR